MLHVRFNHVAQQCDIFRMRVKRDPHVGKRMTSVFALLTHLGLVGCEPLPQNVGDVFCLKRIRFIRSKRNVNIFLTERKTDAAYFCMHTIRGITQKTERYHDICVLQLLG